MVAIAEPNDPTGLVWSMGWTFLSLLKVDTFLIWFFWAKLWCILKNYYFEAYFIPNIKVIVQMGILIMITITIIKIITIKIIKFGTVAYTIQSCLCHRSTPCDNCGVLIWTEAIRIGGFILLLHCVMLILAEGQESASGPDDLCGKCRLNQTLNNPCGKWTLKWNSSELAR